eukprot:5292888-Amphidinium_carterae.1
MAQGQSDDLDQSAEDNESQQCRQWHRVAVDKPGDNHALFSDRGEVAHLLHNGYIDIFDNDFVLTSLHVTMQLCPTSAM